MKDNFGYICASIYSPLIGKVTSYDKSRDWYLLEMPKEKNNKEPDFYYCNYDLHDYMDKWVEIVIKEYTMYGTKYEINKLTKAQLKNKLKK